MQDRSEDMVYTGKMFKTRDGLMIDLDVIINTDLDIQSHLQLLDLSTIDRHEFMYAFAEVNAAKGMKGGCCNITQCQKKGACCFNGGTNAYYCTKCWDDIYQSATYHGSQPCDWITQDMRYEDFTFDYDGGRLLFPKNHPYNEYRKDPASTSKVKTLRRLQPKIGRNDLCPCQSRKKYKKCCMVING